MGRQIVLDKRTARIEKFLQKKPEKFGKHVGHSFSLLQKNVVAEEDIKQRLRNLINLFGNPITEPIRRLIIYDAGKDLNESFDDSRLCIRLPPGLDKVKIGESMDAATTVELDVNSEYRKNTVFSIKTQMKDDINTLMLRFVPSGQRQNLSQEELDLVLCNFKYRMISIPRRWEKEDNDRQMIKFCIGANEGDTRDENVTKQLLGEVGRVRKALRTKYGSADAYTAVFEQGVSGFRLITVSGFPEDLMGVFKPEPPLDYLPIPVEMSISQGIEKSITPEDRKLKKEIAEDLLAKGIVPTEEMINEVVGKRGQQVIQQ